MAGEEPTRIELEAAHWVVLFDTPDWDARDVARFRRWVAKSDAHRLAFVGASETWSDLDLLGRLEAFPIAANDSATPFASRRLVLAGLGAGAAALGVASYAMLAPGSAQALETDIGEVREVALADGTIIILNAATRVEWGERNARIAAGEALFVIAAGVLPFVIKTPFGRIECEAGEILAKVLSECARVSLLSGAAAGQQRSFFRARETPRTDAHNEIVLSRNAVEVAPVASAPLLRRTLWREGQLAFDDAALAEAVEDVARQTGARFEFADPALRELRIGGLIRANDLEGFLRLLRENLAINAEHRDGVIMLSSTASFAP